jgi:predicted PurR-regulated permease PerM
MKLLRFRRKSRHDGPPRTDGVALRLDAAELRELSSIFASPHWLRDLGRTSWFLVGVGAFLFGVFWLLGEAQTIVGPVLIGLVLATVAAPLVTALHRHGLHRAVGALLALLGFAALGALILVLVLGGIVSQEDSIGSKASAAADRAQAWLEDTGVDQGGASSAKTDVEQAVPDIISTLAHGIANGISGITSLAFAIVFTFFSLFFLLKDGPQFRAFVDSHLRVPFPVAQTITGRAIASVRRYFLGVTIVAAFNAVVVGLGALVLGVPLAGTIAVVTFVTAYVPFIGAFVSGAFAVILALGAEGTTTALIMLVIVLLANGALQNIVQPIAFGATLELNPLLILVVTIGAGALFGMIGMILAAPLTSAAFHIAADLARARAAATLAAEPEQTTAPA